MALIRFRFNLPENTCTMFLFLWTNFMQLNSDTLKLRWSFVVNGNPDFYRPQTKLREGNVFTLVCDSVYKGVSVQEGVHCPGRGSLSRKGVSVQEKGSLSRGSLSRKGGSLSRKGGPLSRKGGSLSRKGGSLSGGASVWGSLSRRPPKNGGRVECILVFLIMIVIILF